MKKTQENFTTIRNNVKSHILEDTVLGPLSAEKKTKNEDPPNKITKFIEEINAAKTGNVPCRKSLDSNLTKSSNNFFEKTIAKHEIEGNLTEYIMNKGGKIFHNLTQKKIFLTPKGGVKF